MKRIVLFAGALAACLSCAASAYPSPDDGFMPFWAKFRAAALGGDMNTLATLTRFPLEAGSDYAQDHPGHITRAQFPSLFKTELRCPALDSGSQLDMIKRRANRLDPKYDYIRGARATVGSFEFAKSAGQWRLVTIEFGGDDYRTRLRGRC